MNQKLEDLLQLALQTSEETRARTEELNVGFDTQTRTWELIVKYHGSLNGLEGVQVEYLIAGYAILTVPEQLVDRMVELEEIEYVEKPKRYFYDAEMPTDNSCIPQVTLRDPNLSGAGVLIAVLDSGDGVCLMPGTGCGFDTEKEQAGYGGGRGGNGSGQEREGAGRDRSWREWRGRLWTKG